MILFVEKFYVRNVFVGPNLRTHTVLTFKYPVYDI